MDLLQDARYKDAPVYLFFEKYILDVIGYLPVEKREILEKMNLQEIFKTYARTNWREVLGEVLQFSNTIDIAILNHWYLYVQNANENGHEIDATCFCKQFVDEYFADSSTIDLWTEDSLTKAKSFVKENQVLQSV